MNQDLFKRILVATDGSENAKRAARVAVDLAKECGSELVVVNVIPPLTSIQVGVTPPVPVTVTEQYYKDARARAEDLVEEVISEAKKRGVRVRGVLLDKPYSVVEGITSYAKDEGADLIVLGTRGLGGFKKLLIGSVSSGVVSHAPCSVLVVR